MNISEQQLDQFVNKLFHDYDQDRNKVLSRKEMQNLLTHAFGEVGKKEANKDFIEELMKRYDINRDRVLNKRELKQLIADMLTG